MVYLEYFFKKLFTLVVTLVLVSIVSFLVFEIIPGDSVTALLGTNATKEREEELREELGYNDPVYVRYINWAKNFARGDFGTSLKYKVPVSEILADRLPVTLWLAGMSMILIVFISLPLGVYMAWREHKGKGIIISYINQIVMSVPSFFLGIILIVLFGIVFKLFTPGGYVSYEEDFYGFIRYLIPAAFAIAIPKIAMVAKFTKNSMATEFNADYVRTARSKGAGNRRILVNHIFRNGLLPVSTFIGMVMAEVMAGSIIVEQVLNIPGIGRILTGAVSNRDYPIVQAVIVYIAAVVIIVNCIVDIMYRFIDPRVSVGISDK